MSNLNWSGALWVLGCVGATLLGIVVVHLILDRKWIKRWRHQPPAVAEVPRDIELVEEVEKPAAPPPPPRAPRVFDIGTVFSIARYPLSKTPRDHGLPIRYQLGDRLVRTYMASWSLNNHTTDLTDGEIEAFLRRGDLHPAAPEAPREERVLTRTVALPPVVMRTVALPPVAWSVRTEGAGADDVYAKAPVVRLLKKEGPRTSRYDRILDEDEEESAPGVHSERKDP